MTEQLNNKVENKLSIQFEKLEQLIEKQRTDIPLG